MTSTLRWQLKKAARLGMVLGSWMSGQAPAIDVGRHEPRVRVLTYHRFGFETRDPFCIEPGDFEEQMLFLAERQLAVSLADLQDFIAGNAALPPGAVVVSIDDGFRSLHNTALPILKHYGIPAVAFVTAGLIRSNAAGRPKTQYAASVEEDYLSWDDLTRLADAGIAIGSHAWTHRSLGRMTFAEAMDEASRSRETLERQLGIPIKAFAYPFGTRADFSMTTRYALMLSGYDCAFTSQHGAISPGMDAFVLPRVKVESGERLWMFHLLVRGGLDAWSLIDRALWRVQSGDRGK